jgi:hypothetical protein
MTIYSLYAGPIVSVNGSIYLDIDTVSGATGYFSVISAATGWIGSLQVSGVASIASANISALKAWNPADPSLFLKGDGTWGTPGGTFNTTQASMTIGTLSTSLASINSLNVYGPGSFGSWVSIASARIGSITTSIASINSVNINTANIGTMNVYSIANFFSTVSINSLNASAAKFSLVSATTGWIGSLQVSGVASLASTTYIASAAFLRAYNPANPQYFLKGDGSWGTPTVGGAGTRTIILTAAGAVKSLTNPPVGGLQQNQTTTYGNNFLSMDFDVVQGKYCEWNIKLPGNYANGTAISVQFVWTSDYSTVAGSVTWGILAFAARDSTTLEYNPASATEIQSAADTYQGAYITHIAAPATTLTIANSPVAGDIVHVRVSRKDTSFANGVSNIYAKLMMVKLLYQISQYTDE